MDIGITFPPIPRVHYLRTKGPRLLLSSVLSTADSVAVTGLSKYSNV